MSTEEIGRSQLLDQVVRGEKTLRDIVGELRVSYRQAKRLKAAYVKKGVKGLQHGSRGRTAHNKVSEQVCKQVEHLSREKYFDFNDHHFTEYLNEREQLDISREKVRQIRRKAKIEPKQSRRPAKHRRRRERKPQLGEMMLWDGSHHAWFGRQYPKACLLVAIDDATGMILGAHFEPAETSVGYLRLLYLVLQRHGAPCCVYQDRHGALFRNDDYWSLQEQLRGCQDPTQIGTVLQQLAILPIRALSPQAKGRVERPFGVLQDRLIAELRFNDITDIETANRWLRTVFIDDYNSRFAVPPQDPRSQFREIDSQVLQTILSFRYDRVVANNNTVSLQGLIIDIPPGPSGRAYAKAHVQVLQLLDGSWRVYHQHQLIATHGPTPFRSPKQARKRKSAPGVQEWIWVYTEVAGD